MERILYFRLYDHKKTPLLLESKDRYEIDKITIKYKNSDELIKKYNKKIEEYLKSYYGLSTSVDFSDLGELILFNKNSNIEIPILYKKNILVAKVLMSDFKIMKSLIKLFKVLAKKNINIIMYSDILSQGLIINSAYIETKTRVEELKRNYFNSKQNNYFDKIRIILEAYNEIVKNSNYKLPSLETIYTKISKKNNEQEDSSQLNNSNGIKKEQMRDTILIDGIPYLISDLQNAGLTSMSDIDLARDDLDGYLPKKSTSKK